MVAAVAADEPETAAKIAQPKIFTWSSLPGNLVSQGDNPLNMSSDSLDRSKISPININIGSAASAHEWLCPQIVVARIGPIGAFESNAMPATPVIINANATQTPADNIAISMASSSAVIVISLMLRFRLWLG